MPRWTPAEARREGVLESVELPGHRQQALVERTEVGIIVSISLLLEDATIDGGKIAAERMLIEARRR